MLETLFAFVGIILGLSIAVMILNQMISNALSFRAASLEAGMTEMLETLHPPLKERPCSRQQTHTHAAAITDYVLRQGREHRGGFVIERQTDDGHRRTRRAKSKSTRRSSWMPLHSRMAP